jgi:signal peptide peptidase SppA
MMSDFQYTRILQQVISTPWAILPAKLVVIRDLLAIRASGQRLTDEEVAASMGNRDRDLIAEWDKKISGTWLVNPYYGAKQAAANDGRSRNANSIAVLPLVGTIIPRMNMFSESSGAISVQRFTGAFRAALADPDVASIVIDVDSPGGQVDAVEELSTEIFKARGTKPITAVVNTMAASAAYWIATAADEMVVTPSGGVGSIGVFAMHEDISEMAAMQGVKVSLISAGKYKVEANPFEPLTDEAREAIQQRVDEYYGMFVSAVARNRGVSRSAVRGGYGEGRMVGAKEAVASGMADRVGTLDETISKLASGRRRKRVSSMAKRKIELAALK